MSNQWFRFKNFLVRQEAAAMKVCTDACLFGAVVSAKIAQENADIRLALDIGTGTGLLSLMLAQKSGTHIDAVEIDAAAAAEATQNIIDAGWGDRVRVIQGNIIGMQLPVKYDLVICNPPFYNNHPKSTDRKRNIALHSDALNYMQLTSAAEQTLHPSGIFAVLLPYYLTTAFITATANAGFFLSEQVLVRQTEKHLYFRSILFLTRIKTTIKTWELAIREGDDYSQKFVELLKDYYLNL